MAIYAIGFKNWVELRSYKVEPKPEIDQVTKEIEETESYIDWDGKFHTSKKVVPHLIKTTYYPGGKVVCTLTSSKLKYLGVYVGDGKCVKLNRAQLLNLIRGGFTKLKRYTKTGEKNV